MLVSLLGGFGMGLALDCIFLERMAERMALDREMSDFGNNFFGMGSGVVDAILLVGVGAFEIGMGKSDSRTELFAGFVNREMASNDPAASEDYTHNKNKMKRAK